MPAVVEVLPEARFEALDAEEWYGRQRPQAGDGFAEEFREALRSIAEFPDRWPSHHAGTRRCRFRRFPYGVVYRVFPERVLVVAVAHAKRRPGYCLGR
jgi:plasmid stabilization system protein ParE